MAHPSHLQEAHQLWLELKKQKAGTPLESSPQAAAASSAEAPPTVADPSVSASPATEKPDIEMVDLSMAELPEEPEDPVEKNAREQSLEQLDHVHLFNDKSLLFDAMRQKMSLSSKFGVLIDAQTSRLKINLDYMEAVRDFLAATAVGRYSVCVVIGHRTD